jgi:alpha-mannosidase
MEYAPEAQCLGYHEFDYALVPHSGDWEADEARVLREAQAFNTPVRAAVALQHEGQLASQAALIEVEPRELVVSAIKRSNNGQGLIVRVYNPLSHAVEARLKPGAGITCSKASVTNLQEESREQLLWSGPDDGPVSVGLRTGEITTILFQ